MITYAIEHRGVEHPRWFVSKSEAIEFANENFSGPCLLVKYRELSIQHKEIFFAIKLDKTKNL